MRQGCLVLGARVPGRGPAQSDQLGNHSDERAGAGLGSGRSGGSPSTSAISADEIAHGAGALPRELHRHRAARPSRERNASTTVSVLMAAMWAPA